MLKKIKDKLYYYFAEKNWGVRREYGPYVDAHQEEHANARWKHWWLLVCLNWHYRVLRNSDFYLQESGLPQIKSVKTPSSGTANNNNSDMISYPESKNFKRLSVDEAFTQMKKFDVISFDVFDTLVFRPFEQPKDLFNVIAIESGEYNFKDIRCRTEIALRKTTTKPNGEINIYDIYDALSSRYGIATKWMDREIELELEVCYANPFMKELHDKLLEAGKVMIAVSDMYLPGEIIKKILDKCGYNGIQEVFSSCDCHANKKNGGLQHCVTQTMGRFKKYIHIGDNFNSDCKASREYGWNAIYYENINKQGEKYRPRTTHTIAHSVSTGVINAKMHAHGGKANAFNPYYEYGFICGGILTCGYCEWLNELAERESVDKFFFVARDGDIISKVYNRFYNKIENEYVLASRFALFQADFKNSVNEYLKGVIKRRTNFSKKKKTVQEVLEETELLFLSAKLEEYGLNLQTIFNEEAYVRLEALIFDSADNIQKEFEMHRNAAKQYISDCLGESAKKICIVDLGWTGNCIRMLTDIIGSLCPDVEVIGALMGTNVAEGTYCMQEAKRLFVYLFSQLHNKEMQSAHNATIHNLQYEMMFSSATPSLIEYRLDKSENCFMFGKIEEDNYAITKQIHRGILDFAEEYNKVLNKLNRVATISAYDACSELKQLQKTNSYFFELFSEYREESLAGCFDESKEALTFGAFVKEKI